MIKNFLIGTDPEFIVIDSETREPKSVEGFVEGYKKNPVNIGNGCGMEKDNVTVELTVPPSRTVEEFIGHIEYGKAKINEHLNKYGLSAISASSARYSDKELDSDQARVFGCDPSFCIYTRNVSRRPTAKQVGNLRSAGFHIHIGADRLLSQDEIELLIFYMDMYLGLPSVVIDLDTDRKSIYGNAGDFRFHHKDEGFTIVEYRTLGASLHGSSAHIKYVYDQTVLAIEKFNKQEYTRIDDIEYRKEVRKAIDKNDERLAKSLMEEHGINLSVPSIFEESLVTSEIRELADVASK